MADDTWHEIDADALAVVEVARRRAGRDEVYRWTMRRTVSSAAAN